VYCLFWVLMRGFVCCLGGMMMMRIACEDFIFQALHIISPYHNQYYTFHVSLGKE